MPHVSENDACGSARPHVSENDAPPRPPRRWPSGILSSPSTTLASTTRSHRRFNGSAPRCVRCVCVCAQALCRTLALRLTAVAAVAGQVDHRGQCRLHLVSTNGRETVVVLNFQELSPAKTVPSMARNPRRDDADSVGVGLSIAVEKGVPIVTELSPWGSARWSGKIGVGDEIAAVHGFPVSTQMLSAQQIADLIDDPSQADGSVISISIRRKGRPQEPPITVTLARTPPLDADTLPPERERDYLHAANAPTPPRLRDAVPDVPSQTSKGADAWNPINWATDLVGNRKKPQPSGADTVLAESRKLPPERKRDYLHDTQLNKGHDNLRDLNKGQDTLLRSALEQLLDYVKNVSHENPNIDGRHLNIFQQIDSLPECPYDVDVVRRIKDAVTAEKKELRETVQIVRQSQENLNKRKEHIIKLASQLKTAEEMRHRDLKANNVWMKSELQKERDMLAAELAAEKKRLEDAFRDQHQEQLTRTVQDVNKTVEGLRNNTYTQLANVLVCPASVPRSACALSRLFRTDQAHVVGLKVALGRICGDIPADTSTLSRIITLNE